MTAIVITLELFAALLIAVQAVHRINCMSRCTNLPWFLAWALLGGSAAAIVASVVAGKTVPDAYSAAVLVCAAAVFTLDRRRQ